MPSEWASVEFSLEPLLKPIYPVLEAVDGVLSFLIAVLNVVQKILDVLKAFLIGLLDPIRPLVELILEEIRAIIRDLRQIGLYLAGDWALLDASNNQAYLLGGYAAYEQRMVARLLDTRDPKRPDFSPATSALGVFLYASSGDISDISRVARAILNLFGRGDLLGKSGPFPTPTTPSLTYGAWSSGLSSFRNLSQSFDSGSPDSVAITWSMPTGTSKSPFKSPAPKGFLLHVSTTPDGLEVVTSTSNPTSADPNSPPRILGGAVDPVTNAPLKLYGGVADLGVASDAKDFTSVEASDNAQAPLLLLKKDQTTPLIKPSTLARESGPPLLGCTYYLRMGVLSPQRIGGGTQYTAVLQLSDLPLNASFAAGPDGFAEVAGEALPAQNYWVRVRALDKNYVDFAESQGLSGSLSKPISVYSSNLRIFQFSNSMIKGAAVKNGVVLPSYTGGFGSSEAVLSFKDLTGASGAGVLTVPTENQRNYILAVQTALALAILCRGDLTEYSKGNYKNVFNTGYALGFESKIRGVFGSFGIDENFFKETRPQVFRQKLRVLLGRFPQNSPPEGVITSLLGQTEGLLNFTWDLIDSNYPNLTILESLGIGGDPTETEGVGANPFCRTLPRTVLEANYAREGGPDRAPSFVEAYPLTGANHWILGEGSADNSPILFNDRASANPKYIRNAVFNYNSGELLQQANLILSIATCKYALPAADGGWLAIRLMPEALVPLDQLLGKVEKFVLGILDGLQGVIEQIVKYIEAIQARIYQLQALLELIRSLLNSISLFQLPSLSALVLTAEGTSGLTTGLLASENKPSDDASDYGFGVLAVAGGIPTFLLDLLALIFSGGG